MGRERTKFKDNRDRTLKDGERQLKDGRYEYRYIDNSGKRRSIYSWRLIGSDKTPPGKKDNPPLRQLEREIVRDIEEGLLMDGGDFNVYQLTARYVNLRKGVSQNTRAGYKTVLKTLEKHPFGKKKIKSVKTTDAKQFLASLQTEMGKSYSTIHNIRGVLRPAFKMAVEDDLIPKNPFDFELSKWVMNDSCRRTAITPEDERRFLKFVKQDEHFSEYYPAIYILFNTGLRISELCGLTVSDIDLERKVISVTHQLQRDREGNLYIIDKDKLRAETKTRAGIRQVPMRKEVHRILTELIENREALKEEPEVDGYSKFLFLNHRARKGLRPMVAMDYEHIFKHCLDKFNDIYRVPMPKVTPHVCRHTFCTNMVRHLMEPVTLQVIMGHSDINITLSYYTHLNINDAKAGMEEVDKRMEAAEANEAMG